MSPAWNPDTHSYEVFVQLGTGKPIRHVGSVRSYDPVLAWQAGKEAYTRRDECTLLWVVPRSAIIASTTEDATALKAATRQNYRLPGYPSKHRRARMEATAQHPQPRTNDTTNHAPTGRPAQ